MSVLSGEAWAAKYGAAWLADPATKAAYADMFVRAMEAAERRRSRARRAKKRKAAK